MCELQQEIYCQDTDAFGSNDKTFIPKFYHRLNERIHTNFACFNYCNKTFAMSFFERWDITAVDKVSCKQSGDGYQSLTWGI